MNSNLETGRRAPFALVPEWIVLADISPQAKALYVLLITHVNHQRGDRLAWPGMDVMAVILGYSKRQSVSKYVRELEQAGAVEVRVATWKAGRRNTYVVHETPPPGYTGYTSVVDFHADRERARRELEVQIPDRPGSGHVEGGRPPQGTTHGPPEGTTHRPPQGTRTRGTQPLEGESFEVGTSSGGTPVGGDAAASPRPLHGKALTKQDDKTLTKTLTSVWCAVVIENGGYLPQQGEAGWEPGGEAKVRGTHPIGSQVKAWIQGNPTRTAEDIDQALTQIREHAEAWATNQHRSAA